MKYLLIFLLILIVFITAIILGAKNNQLIQIDYLLAKGEYRISSLLAILFITGFIIGWLICGFFWIRVQFSLIRAERKIKILEKKVISTNAISAASIPTTANMSKNKK